MKNPPALSLPRLHGLGAGTPAMNEMVVNVISCFQLSAPPINILDSYQAKPNGNSNMSDKAYIQIDTDDIDQIDAGLELLIKEHKEGDYDEKITKSIEALNERINNLREATMFSKAENPLNKVKEMLQHLDTVMAEELTDRLEDDHRGFEDADPELDGFRGDVHNILDYIEQV